MMCAGRIEGAVKLAKVFAIRIQRGNLGARGELANRANSGSPAAGDPDFDATLRQGLAVELGQSPFLSRSAGIGLFRPNRAI
jgi:hypothetical protein